MMKPLGDGVQSSLIKMLIAPVIFCTVVTGTGRGIASMQRRHKTAGDRRYSRLST